MREPKSTVDMPAAQVLTLSCPRVPLPGLLLPRRFHKLQSVPGRLLLPHRRPYLLRLPDWEILWEHGRGVHELPWWPVPEHGRADGLQGVRFQPSCFLDSSSVLRNDADD